MFAVTIGGKKVWKINTENEVVTPPFIKDDRIYFGTIEGDLVCADKKTGNMISRKNITGKIIVTKNFGNNIFLSCYDCKVICTDLEGNKKWIFKTSISHVSPVKLDKVISDSKEVEQIMEIPSLSDDPELYKPVVTMDKDSESIYGGLNLTYTSSSKYRAKFRYGN